MNTLYKLLKITGAVCLSCVCSISNAEPKFMTLEELRKFLDQQCTKDTKAFETIREKIKAGNQKGFAPICNETKSSYSYDIPKEFSENFKGIAHVEYNTDGEPTVIETVNGWNSEVLNILQDISCGDTPFRQYIRKRFSGKTSAECLDSVSKELTAKELKTRGITDTDMKRYEIAFVREITFNSILSGFFNEKEANKGHVLFSDPEKLEKSIDAYVSKTMFLKSVTYRRKDTCLDLVIEPSLNDLTFKIREKAQQPNEYASDFVYKESGERRERMKQILANGLKDLLRYKNGKEKVILLLLLEEATQLDCKLKWMHESGNHGEYDAHKNLILFDFEAARGQFLSHEVGHYLQTHLGLDKDLQTYPDFRMAFEGYQTKFAKELLLSEPIKPKTDKEIHIPSTLSSSLAIFYDNPHLLCSEICFDRLSEGDLFTHWQLVSRWDNRLEISNILGIYFGSSKTIYIYDLSDIRELRRIRYGHDVRNQCYSFLKDPNGEYRQKFETPESQTAFENIVAEAAEQKPSIDALKFLCKLHKRSDDSESKIVNLFDYESKESFLAHGFSHLQDFKTADK